MTTLRLPSLFAAAALLAAAIGCGSSPIDPGTSSSGGGGSLGSGGDGCGDVPVDPGAWPAAASSDGTAGPPLSLAWARSLGSGTSQGDFIASDEGGGVVVSGIHGAPLDLGLGVLLGADVGRYLARFDPSGQALWAVDMTDLAAGVAVDPPGNVYTASNPGGMTVISAYDPQGNMLWTRTLPIDDPHVVGAAGGGLFVTGAFASAIDLDAGPLAPVGFDLAVIALDPDGEMRWATSLGAWVWTGEAQGAVRDLTFSDVASAPDGGAAVVATTLSTCSSGESTSVVIARLGPSGALDWLHREAQSELAGPGLSAAVAESGDVALLGRGGVGLGVALLSATGERRWRRVIAGDVEVVRPVFDPTGNLVLAGSFAGSLDLGGGPLTAEAGSLKLLVARLSPDGAHLASQSYGGLPQPNAAGSDSRCQGLAVDPSGRVLLTGFYAGALDFGAGPLPDVPAIEGGYGTSALIATLEP